MLSSGDQAPIVKPGTHRQPSIVDDTETTVEDPVPPPESPDLRYNEAMNDPPNKGDIDSDVGMPNEPDIGRVLPSVTTTATTATAVVSEIKTDFIDNNDSKNDVGLEMQQLSSGDVITQAQTLVLSQFQLAAQSQDMNDRQLIARFAVTLCYLLLRLQIMIFK